MSMMPDQPPITPKKKGGLFGSGVPTGDLIAAILAGALAGGGSPAGAMGMQMLQQKRRDASERDEYQRRRSDTFEDWVKQQAYKQAHPDPNRNDTEVDYEFIKRQLGDGPAQEFLRTKTLAPPMMVPGPNGQMFMVPRVMPQQGPPQGVTFTPMDEGGPTPPASGGFPRPY